MKAVVWHGTNDVTVDKDFPEPVPAAGEVVLDVECAGICGSDLHAYRGQPGLRKPPLVLGHEAIGSVTGDSERFAVYPLIACGHCDACKRGNENLCEDRKLLGLDRQGVFAERVSVPRSSLVPIPTDMDASLAVLTEPLATVMGAVKPFVHQPHFQRVLVIGCGAMGLLAVHSLSEHAQVTAVDPVPERRHAAKQLGAAEVSSDSSELPRRSADLVLDAVGIAQTWNEAISITRSGGVVTVIGLGQREGPMAVGDIVRRGLSVTGQYAYTRADFVAALELLRTRPPRLDWLTTVPFDEAPTAFRNMAYQPSSAIKVLISPR